MSASISPETHRVGAIGKILLALFLLGAVGTVMATVNVRAAWYHVELVGTGLIAILLVHLFVIAIDGLGWLVLVPDRRPSAKLIFFWLRWVRESVNLLLPVAQIGGEAAGARLLAITGMPIRMAVASVAVDKIAEALALPPFTLLGLTALIALRGTSNLADAVALGLVAVGGVVISIGLAWHAGAFAIGERRLTALIGPFGLSAVAKLSSIGDALKAVSHGPLIVASSCLHLTAWIINTGEVWLALRFMGHPLGITGSLALESLGSAITAAAFFVPGAIGIQEGAYVAVGTLFGLPPEIGLALSLVKRARQILLGVPALASWELTELRGLLLYQPEAQGAAPIERPSNASDSCVRRFSRYLVQPLAAIPVKPEHITVLHFVCGVAACAGAALGTVAGNWWAGCLWILSCLLERAHREFVRSAHERTEQGRFYDLVGDPLLNGGVFLAVGVGLSGEALGGWAIALGLWVMLVVASASVIAATFENSGGGKVVALHNAFDFGDAVFVVAPILWSGHTELLLVGAAMAGPVIAAWMFWRMLRLPAQGRRNARADDS